MNKLVTAVAVLFLCACDPASGPASRVSPPVVTVIHNAVIHTVDPAMPRAGAMAFSSADGSILAIGSDAVVLSAWPGAQTRDLEGRTVIPGLIDSHGHLDGLAEAYTTAGLAGTRDVDEILVRLAEQEQRLGEGDWLLGRGWDQNDWPVKEFPSRNDLDARWPDRPVWLRRIDGHAGWANSAALAMADRDLSGDWQPEGGFIHRGADGQPTGVLIDKAMALVEAAIPPTPDAVMMGALDLALAEMVSLGLTGVHDPGIGLEALDRYQRKLAAGAFPTRAYLMTEGAGDVLDWLCANGPIDDPSGRLVFRATKLYSDGALGSRGAALLADYADAPGNRGLLFQDAATLQAQAEKVMACGFQAAIHAIGDAANREVLNALEAAITAHPDNPGRHRIEHVQVLDAADLPRLAQLGIIGAMQPIHATSDMYWAGDRLGPEREQFAYAWRALLDSGARLAFGSDFPVEVVNPMLGLYAAVSRTDLEGWPEGGWHPEQAVTREEALRGFTLDAAHAGFMEEQVGSLSPGKRADFVVLDRDLMTVPETEIPHIRVLETWLDGQAVYRAAGPGPAGPGAGPQD